jgi:hypothetical protein
VEQQVILNLGLPTPTAEPAKQALGVEVIAVAADQGYSRAATSGLVTGQMGGGARNGGGGTLVLLGNERTRSNKLGFYCFVLICKMGRMEVAKSLR